jgi:hypothetical protein
MMNAQYTVYCRQGQKKVVTQASIAPEILFLGKVFSRSKYFHNTYEEKNT